MKKFLQKLHFEYFLTAVTVTAALIICSGINPFAALSVLIICIFYGLFTNKTKGFIASCAVIAMVLCAYIRNIPEHNTLEEKLDRRPFYGKICFELIDPLWSTADRISNGDTALIRIISVEDMLGNKIYGSGKFLLFARDTLPGNARYGDIYEVEGSLRFSSKDIAWYINDNTAVSCYKFGNFHKYMQLRSISGMISPDKNSDMIKKAENNSFFKQMLLLRDKTLSYINSNIEKKENCDLVGALFFGLKGALDKKSKNDFIRSGTVHLFSVSGLHIGILFAVLLPLLIWVPVRWRYLCATLLMIPFLLTTGANTPAVRAFLMILSFSLLRTGCYYIEPLRILAAGCAFFLIMQPEYLHDAGFLYSFGITAILLLAAQKTILWRKIWKTDELLKASDRKNPAKYRLKSNILQKIVFAFIATAAAFAVGSVITLYTFGYLYFAPIWINFFIIFFCSWLIFLFIIKIIITPVPLLGALFCNFFEKNLDFMSAVTEFGSTFPMQINTMQVPVAAAILFYIALILLICAKNKLIFTVAGVFVIMIFPVTALLSRLQPEALLIIRSPYSENAAFIYADPSGDFSWSCNIRDTESAEIARKFLSSRGINHINFYFVGGSAGNTVRAMQKIQENIRINELIHLQRRKKIKSFELHPNTFYKHSAQQVSNWEYSRNLNKFFCKKSQIGFEYFTPKTSSPLKVIFDSNNALLKIDHNGKHNEQKMENSNILEYFIYEF